MTIATPDEEKEDVGALTDAWKGEIDMPDVARFTVTARYLRRLYCFKIIAEPKNNMKLFQACARHLGQPGR